MENLLKIISEEPKNIDARMKLAEMYIDAQEYDNAFKMLNEVISIDSKQTQANYILAQLYEHKEKYDKAVECMEKVIKDRTVDELQFKMAELYEHVDNYKDALKIYEDLFKHHPSDIDICGRIANSHRILGDYDDAILYYNKILMAEPDNIFALTGLLDLYENKDKFYYHVTKAKINEVEGQLSYAISEYSKAAANAEDKENNIFARTAIAEICMKKEDYNKAIDQYIQIIELDDSDYTSYKGLATAYLKLDHEDEAANVLQKALDLNPVDTDAMEELVDIYLNNDKFEEALDILNKLSDIDSSNLEYKTNIATAYVGLNKLGLAKEMLEEVLSKEPKNIEAISVLIDYCIAKDDKENAISYADLIKEILPKSPFGYRRSAEVNEKYGNEYEMHYNYGIFHDLKGEKQLAIDEFSIALNFDENNTEVIHKIARLYEDLSEDYIAVEYYFKAYNTDSTDIYALERIGDIYYRKNEWEKAIEAYEKLLEIDESNKETYIKMADCYENIKNYDMALDYYKTFVEKAPTHNKADYAKQKVEALKQKFQAEEDEGFLNKIMSFFTKK